VIESVYFVIMLFVGIISIFLFNSKKSIDNQTNEIFIHVSDSQIIDKFLDATDSILPVTEIMRLEKEAIDLMRKSRKTRALNSKSCNLKNKIVCINIFRNRKGKI
jgi:hypothetical protein